MNKYYKSYVVVRDNKGGKVSETREEFKRFQCEAFGLEDKFSEEYGLPELYALRLINFWNSIRTDEISLRCFLE